MANKLYLDNNDYDAPYEPSDSEEEYSEEEKELLKEIRQRNKRKPESKKEVLAFDDNSDDQGGDDDGEDDDGDIIGDSDIERGDEDDGIPDAKAWGKQRRSYYNTDFVDQDYSAYNEQEEEQAQQEEEEAKSIQLRLAKQLDEADFFLDMPEAADEIETESSKKEDETKTKLKTDLSGLSDREKQQLFEKDSPEFTGLVNDFQIQLLESQDLLNPILEFAAERNLHLPIFEFAEMRNNLILTYCNNVAIYLLLKAKRIPIKYHPITKRLAQLRKILIQMQEKYNDVVRPQLEELLEKIQSGEEVEILEKTVEKKPKKKLRMMKGYTEAEGQSEEEEDEGEEDAFKDPGNGVASSDDEDDGEGEEDEDNEGDMEERRGITYQIAKNKGLTAHRKKELRNPRVKHRSKFRKALIRRKGAVRTVRKEIQRYGGEISGIKVTVKKGIKIKT